jgi:antirestriction protein ArdC
LFHELAHSTGHENRLNRKELVNCDGFGNTSYAKEELTAEMTAAFLCAITGIHQPTIADSAAYIQTGRKLYVMTKCFL